MEVRWSPLVAEDPERIFRLIEKNNPTAARQTVKAIYDGCAALKDSLSPARRGRITGRRELVYVRLPYIAVYQVKKHAVEISRIYHGAQDWP